MIELKHCRLGVEMTYNYEGLEEAKVMEEHKVKHIQFIFDDGECHVVTGNNDKFKLAFTELDDLLMAKDLDGFAICITTKFGGQASFVTDRKAKETAQKEFSEEVS